MLVGSAMRASAQTWTETSCTETITQNDDSFNTLSTAAGAQYEIAISVHANFTCTGDTTQAPAWRFDFESLCNNWWWDAYDYYYTAPYTGTATEHVVYDVRAGSDNFSCTSPVATASRTVSSNVDSYSYVSMPFPGGSGGGGA